MGGLSKNQRNSIEDYLVNNGYKPGDWQDASEAIQSQVRKCIARPRYTASWTPDHRRRVQPSDAQVVASTAVRMS